MNTLKASILKNILILVISLMCCTTASAINYPSKPANTDFYVDGANLISPQDRTQINQICSQLWQSKHVFMIVVTIQSLAAQQATDTTVDGYARSLFDYWGIGSQKDNNGILLLISKDDRHARIELGKSWGHNYDAQTNTIMQRDIIPQFKQGHFSTGILNGVTSLSAMANGVYKENWVPPKLTPMQIGLVIAGIILIIAIVFSLFKSGRTGWGWALIAFAILDYKKHPHRRLWWWFIGWWWV